MEGGIVKGWFVIEKMARDDTETWRTVFSKRVSDVPIRNKAGTKVFVPSKLGNLDQSKPAEG